MAKVRSFLSNKKELNIFVLILFVFILGIGSFLRFYNLAQESLWLDEFFSWQASSYNNLHDVIFKDTDGHIDFYPPGYRLFLHFIIKLFGDSETILRLPSVISGILSIVIIFLLGSHLYTYKEGIIASGFMAVLNAPVYSSQEARAYSILLLFSLLSTYFWILILRNLNKSVKVVNFITFSYIISAIICLYLHYHGLYLIFLQALGITLFFIFKPKILLRISIIYSLILLAYLPWFSGMIMHFDLGRQGGYLETATSLPNFFGYFNYYCMFLFSRSPKLTRLVLILYLFFFFQSLYSFWKNKRYKSASAMFMSPTTLMLFWFIIPFAGIYITKNGYLMMDRNLIISLPAACILLSRSITNLPLHSVIKSLIAFLLTLFMLHQLLFSVKYYSIPQKDGIRQIVEFVLENDPSYKDSIIISWGAHPFIFNYYFEKKGSSRRIDVVGFRTGDLTLKKYNMDEVVKKIMIEKPHYVWVCVYLDLDEVFREFMRKNLTLVKHKQVRQIQVYLFKNLNVEP